MYSRIATSEKYPHQPALVLVQELWLTLSTDQRTTLLETIRRSSVHPEEMLNRKPISKLVAIDDLELMPAALQGAFIIGTPKPPPDPLIFEHYIDGYPKRNEDFFSGLEERTGITR